MGSYGEALDRARKSGQDIVVFQRGSDWNRLGEVLYHDVWLKPEFAHELGNQFLLVEVDHPEVLGGRAVQGQCTSLKCGVTGFSDVAVGSSPPLRLARLVEDQTPLPASEVTGVASTEGAVYRPRKDGAWVAEGANPAQDTLTLTLKTARAGKLLRLDFPTDPRLPGQGPGRASNGNFVVGEVEVSAGAAPLKCEAAWSPTGEGKLAPFTAIDGVVSGENGWNAHGERHCRAALLLVLAREVPAGTELKVQLICRGPWGQHVPGCVRAALVPEADTIEANVRVVASAQMEAERNAKFTWADHSHCPRLALMDSQGRAAACEINPRIGWTPHIMARRILELRQVRIRRDELWAGADKVAGAPRAELLRQGLELMGFHNWPGNDNCYKVIHDRIKEADPKDESGARRWLGFGGDPRHGVPWAEPSWSKALEGKNLKDSDYQEALARIDRELKDPRNRILSHEQIQRMMVARYHVYKRWPGHEEQRFAVQKEIAALDPTTFWGVGAVGYLGMYHRTPTPLVTYGWEGTRQIKAGLNTWDMTDTAYYFDHSGPYQVRLSFTGGKDTVKVRRVALLDDGKILTEAGPEADLGPGRPPVDVALDLREWRADRKLVLRVVIEAQPGHLDNNGNFGVEPLLLPAPAASGGAPAVSAPPERRDSLLELPASPDRAALVAYQKRLGDRLHSSTAARTFDNPVLRTAMAQHEVLRACGVDRVLAVAGQEGGPAFLKAFLADPAWVESFLASGLADWPQALENLRLLHRYSPGMEPGVYQGLATALALQAGGMSRYRLVDRYRHIRKAREEGLLHAGFDNLTVREMRWAVLLSGTAADYQFLLDDRQTTSGEYLGACWAIAYIDPNVYGYSVQGWGYINEWCHVHGTGTGDRPFSAHRQVGGVCGTLSGYGAAVAKAHGVMAATVGQPGHCAYVVRLGDVWPIGNAVSGPDSTGFGVPGWEGTGYTTANRLWETVEADRVAFIKAQRLCWLARLQRDRTATPADWTATYEAALAAQPINFANWLETIKALQGVKDLPAATWPALARRAARTFAPYNEAGWALVMRCLERALPAMKPAERVAILLECHEQLRQDHWLRPEGYALGNYLNLQADRIGDPLLAVEFFGKLLSIHHSKDPSNNWIFNTVLIWGQARFGTNPATAQAHVKALDGFFTAHKDALDRNFLTGRINEGIRKASDTGDIAGFRLWNELARKVLPPLVPADVHLSPAQVKEFPRPAPFPGLLLSEDGLLQTSSACRFDRPLSYGQVLSGGFGGWFDTNVEEKPWAQVQLPAEGELMGVILVNRYEYAPTQEEFRWAAPLRVSISGDAKTWTPIASFDQAQAVYRIDLTGKGLRARYVRIERVPGTDKGRLPGRFHFRSFLIFGKKLS
jgi:hypothetical protein